MDPLGYDYEIKNTFVHAFVHIREGDAQGLAALSPRASSDPGSLSPRASSDPGSQSSCSMDALCGGAKGALGVGRTSRTCLSREVPISDADLDSSCIDECPESKREAGDLASFSPLASRVGEGTWIFGYPMASTAYSMMEPEDASNAAVPVLPTIDRTQTTIMIRHSPNRYKQDMFLRLLDERGFNRCYDFLYAPMDFFRGLNLGIALVNFTTHDVAKRFRDEMDGFRDWRFDSGKKWSLSWTHPLQGKEEHVKRYRNSPVMHESIPAKYKPMIFENGQRVDFPPPTRIIRAPKHRPMGYKQSPAAGGWAHVPNHRGVT